MPGALGGGSFPSSPAREGLVPRFPGASSASAGRNLRAGPRHVASRGQVDRTEPGSPRDSGPLWTLCQVSWPAGQAEVAPVPHLSPNCCPLACSFADPTPSLQVCTRGWATHGPLQPCCGPGAVGDRDSSRDRHCLARDRVDRPPLPYGQVLETAGCLGAACINWSPGPRVWTGQPGQSMCPRG